MTTLGYVISVVALIVIVAVILYVREAKKGHPKGLIAAALSNMGERFGYYIMNAVLVLFICSKFGIDDKVAGVIYSIFYFSIYIFLGNADRGGTNSQPRSNTRYRGVYAGQNLHIMQCFINSDTTFICGTQRRINAKIICHDVKANRNQ